MIFGKQVIYNLKHRFGVKGDVYAVGAETINRETGAVTSSLTKYSVRRLIALPVTLTRLLTPLGLSGQFADVEIDVDSRLIIVDDASVASYKYKPKDYFVIKNLCYAIQKEINVEGVARAFLARRTRGVPVIQIAEMTERAITTDTAETQ